MLEDREERAAAMREEVGAMAMPVKIEVNYAARPGHLEPEAGPGLVKCPKCGRLAGCLWRFTDGSGGLCSECIRRLRIERQREREESGARR